MVGRSRRRRRRAGAPRRAKILGPVVAVGILLMGVIALHGVASGAKETSGYLTQINQSFASQINTVFEAQQVQGRQLEDLLNTMPSLSRATLAGRLETLASQTAVSARTAATAANHPAPSKGTGPMATSITALRAQATAQIASAVSGLLQLDVPVVAGSAVTPTSAAPVLSAAAAQAQLAQAGSLLAKADQEVGPLRATLLGATGHAYLIRSVFIVDHGLLEASAMTGLIAALQTSPTLAPVHQLALTTYSIEPAPLPSTSPHSGVVQLPPTTSMLVHVTVRNKGNVSESHVVVQVTLATAQGAALSTVTATGVAEAGGWVSLDLPQLRVTPGTQWQLTISVNPAAGQVGNEALSRQLTVVIAPSSNGSTVAP